MRNSLIPRKQNKLGLREFHINLLDLSTDKSTEHQCRTYLTTAEEEIPEQDVQEASRIHVVSQLGILGCVNQLVLIRSSRVSGLCQFTKRTAKKPIDQVTLRLLELLS